jgi:hypothetical protein
MTSLQIFPKAAGVLSVIALKVLQTLETTYGLASLLSIALTHLSMDLSISETALETTIFPLWFDYNSLLC